MGKVLMAALLCGLAVIRPSWAAEEKDVQIPHRGLTLNGHLMLANGKAIKDGVVLITHGTLAHGRMELMQALQPALAERGFSSLALTLSLGVDKRVGMYDCAVPHRHRHVEAVDEIGSWVGWLKGQGAAKVAVLGHSRGGNQTALYALDRPDPVVSKVVLLAPMTWNEADDKAQFQARHGKPMDKPLNEARRLVKAGKAEGMMKGAGLLYCPGANASAASFTGYYEPDRRFHTPNLLARIKKPVLVVAAGADEVVKGLPEAVKPLADGKKVSLVTVANSDHMFLDLAAEDAADAVAKFLAQ
jgi:pimeloyl-ACP methyl ester carboxylesterase